MVVDVLGRRSRQRTVAACQWRAQGVSIGQGDVGVPHAFGAASSVPAAAVAGAAPGCALPTCAPTFPATPTAASPYAHGAATGRRHTPTLHREWVRDNGTGAFSYLWMTSSEGSYEFSLPADRVFGQAAERGPSHLSRCPATWAVRTFRRRDIARCASAPNAFDLAEWTGSGER